MMKKFKHKTLWWIAKPVQDDNMRLEEKLVDKYDIFAFPNGSCINNCRIFTEELIELWFEEVVEKDWISYLYEFILWDTKPTENSLREYIEQHAPKVKKFTIDELKKYQQEKRDSTDPYYHILIFCKDHWLLEE